MQNLRFLAASEHHGPHNKAPQPQDCVLHQPKIRAITVLFCRYCSGLCNSQNSESRSRSSTNLCHLVVGSVPALLRALQSSWAAPWSCSLLAVPLFQHPELPADVLGPGGHLQIQSPAQNCTQAHTHTQAAFSQLPSLTRSLGWMLE